MAELRRPDGPGKRVDNSIPISIETLNTLKSMGKQLSNSIDTNKEMNSLLKNTKNEQIKNVLAEENRAKVQNKVFKDMSKMITTLSKKSGLAEEKIIEDLMKEGNIFSTLPDQLKHSFKQLKYEMLWGQEGKGNRPIEDILKTQIKEKKEENGKLKTFFKGTLDSLNKITEKHEDIMKQTVLGPLSLLVSPIEDFVGGSFFSGIKGFFEKRSEKRMIKKKNPSDTDLVKKGDIGFLYLGNKLAEIFGKAKEKAKGGLEGILGGITGLFGNIKKSVGPMLGKMGGIAAIVGGLVWSVIDGFAALGKSDEWKASKVGSFIGGMLAGPDTEKTWAGAFKNMGKWALVGLGIGAFMGPVGMLAGALIGAAIGGIFYAIGGANIARGFDKIVKWVVDIFNSKFVQQAVNWIGSIFGRIFTFFGDQFKTIGDMATGKIDIFTGISQLINNILKLIGGLVSDFFMKNPIGKIMNQYIIQPIVNFFNSIGDFFAFIGSKNPLDLVSMIAGGTFGTELGTYREKEIKKRQDIKKTEILQAYLPELKKEFEVKDERAKKMGMAESVESMIAKNPNYYIDYLIKKKLISPSEVTNVQDAIIKPDGSVIQTSRDDTLIATKNIPSINGKNSATGAFVGGSVEAKLDTMISLLKKLLDKEINVSMPPQTARELDLLISGVML